MRKLILVFLIALIAEDVCSQGDHFIYIQSDNQKPYYLRFGSKMLRSSGEGYLVIQGLSSNNYEFFIGFPDAAPGVEWRFDCALGEKDLGFTLKNSGASPQLINLGQKDGLTGTKVQVKEEKKIATQPVQLTGIVSDDAFSKMLADVVNDPTIRQQPVIIEKKVEPVLVAGIPGKDSAGIAKGKADSLASSTALATAAAKVPSVSAKDSIKAVASAVAKNEDKPLTTKETVTKPDSGNSKAITQKQDSANLANTVAAKKGEEKPFVVKETITKPDSGNSKAITQKQDSANLANTVASKKGEDKPFVVKETKGNNQPTAASVKTDSSIAKVAKNANEPFVIKETVDNNGKLSVSKDSVGNASIAQAKESKPVVSSEKPKEEPFVVKELTKTENKAAKANDNPSDKKTLPFTVQPQGEIAVAKEVPKNDNKISKAVDSSVQKTTAAVIAQPKQETAVGKEVPKTDNKTTQNSTAAGTDKTTAAVTSPPKEDKSFVLKETIADKNNQADKIASPSALNKNAITSSVSIKKTLQRKSIDGIELIYVDEGANGVKDTIRILIPAIK